MTRNPFGWSLPPGCTHRMVEEAFGREAPCDVCGKWVDDCICPECPVCRTHGDPQCYEQHGLTRSEAQIASRAALDAEIAAEAARWDAWDAYGAEVEEDNK